MHESQINEVLKTNQSDWAKEARMAVKNGKGLIHLIERIWTSGHIIGYHSGKLSLETKDEENSKDSHGDSGSCSWLL